jgi:hypothetical protein
MATPSGQISLSDVNAELGFSPTALITMNDAAVRNLAGVPTGAISMANLQGKSGRTVVSLTIAANVNNYDVYANRGPTYVAGNTDLTVTINPGVRVSGFSTGSYALLVPASFNPGDTVTIVNNGTIQGAGGNGGGRNLGNPAIAPGLPGGNAVYVNRPTVITNNGNMWAGGGGGGAGGTGNLMGRLPTSTSAGGGGGGQGSLGGNGGVPGPGANVGGAGSPTGAGAGASTPVNAGLAGPGGGAGANGVAGNPGPRGAGGTGGSAGFYIVGNPFVTYPATGSRLGQVG